MTDPSSSDFSSLQSNMFWGYVRSGHGPRESTASVPLDTGRIFLLCQSNLLPAPLKTAICSEIGQCYHAASSCLPASTLPACQRSGSAVNHSSTVKVRCMLKRPGLLYPENPALLEGLRTHLCTQPLQPSTAQLNRQFTMAHRQPGRG